MICEQLVRMTLWLLSSASAVVLLYAFFDRIAQVWRNLSGYRIVLDFLWKTRGGKRKWRLED